MPGLALINARITAGQATWQIKGEGDATPIILAQGAHAGELFVADFADPNYEGIVASLRVVHASNETAEAAGGVLSIPGHGAWPVICMFE